MTTHYDVLGVRRDASPQEVKRAYYRRARAFHPDAHAGSASEVVHEAARAMAALNAAWNVLRDPTLRTEYDHVLHREALERREPRNAKRRSTDRHGRAAAKVAPRQLPLGRGLRSHLGQLATAPLTVDGRPRLNLTVDPGADLSVLEPHAPDGVWGLHAQRSGLGDRDLEHLRGLHGLQLLDLSGTAVTDAGLVHLQHLERLAYLVLWDTAITDQAMSFVGKLFGLRELGLGQTRITDAGLQALRDLDGLRILQLWGTDVRGPGLVHLHHLQDLEIVTLPRRVEWKHRWRLRRALPHALVE